MASNVKQKKIHVNIPSWVATVYVIFALALIPWTIYLAYSLPIRHIEKHWDLSWVGLDIGIIIILLLTGFLASIKSRLVIISFSVAASFLLVDAWFDLISAKPGAEFFQALVLAIIVEIPLSILGYYLAYITINRNVD